MNADRPLVRRLPIRGLLAGVLTLATSGAGAADDVYLTNGGVFQGVETSRTETHVVVRLQIGQLRLPVGQVVRVVERETPYVVYAERKAELLANGAAAEEFVALARWAVHHSLEAEWREAALIAARLDPGTAGIETLMAEMSYQHDAELGWIPHSQAMERRGLVEVGGEWVSPEEAELRRRERAVAERLARLEAEERLRRRRAEAPADAQVSSNEVALASIELAREVVAENRGVDVGRVSGLAVSRSVLIPTLPLSGGGGFVVGHVPVGVPRGSVGARSRDLEAIWRALETRQPGSIIPLSAFQTNDR